jgi:hypothetical protein
MSVMAQVLQKVVASTEAIDEKADLCVGDVVDKENPVITTSEFAYKVRTYDSCF